MKERKLLRCIKEMKTNWLGHVLRRNCLTENIIGGGIKRKKKKREDVGRSHW